MTIEIRCTPYSQSAIVQIVVQSVPDFDTSMNPAVFVVVGERGYESDYTKQRLGYYAGIKKDDTNTVNINFSFTCYPLHSETEYEINAYFVQRINVIIPGTKWEYVYENTHLNFSTGAVQTVGVQSDREIEIPLADKQKNAKYLYNQIVKTNKMSLESFSCLLGLMDCAGNLNPTAYMCYESFNGDNILEHYSPNNFYNHTYQADFFTGVYPDDYKSVVANIILGEYYPDINRYYIKQNGITILPNNDLISTPQYGYTSYSSWYYNTYDNLYDIFGSYDPLYGRKYKKAKAFTCLPFYHHDYTIFLYKAMIGSDTENALNLFKRSQWLTIESVAELLLYLIDTTSSQIYSDWWDTNVQEFRQMYATYPTMGKFGKCKSTNIERNAEFVFECFKGGKYGSLAYDTSLVWQSQEYVEALYHLECVKNKARYWYDYFKKRRHPWWIYIKWNI